MLATAFLATRGDNPVDIHDNAVLTPRGWASMVARVVRHGWSYRATARHYQIDPRTVRRRVVRFQAVGLVGANAEVRPVG